MTDQVVSTRDGRLIAALQCDPRVSAERAADVLGLSTRVVQQRWAAMAATGAIGIIARPPLPTVDGAMMLRIRMLRGKLDPLSKALAHRKDVLLVEVNTSGDQLVAIVMPPLRPGPSLLEELPTSSAILDIAVDTIIHVFSNDSHWIADYLTPEERRALEPAGSTAIDTGGKIIVMDDIDKAIAARLALNARLSASAIARSIGEPESTVRRRLNTLFERRQLVAQVAVNPRSLGFPVDADLRMQVAPERLDHAGGTLAVHPAVHGALATTGPTNLTIAVWLRNLDHLYRFITHDLADLGVSNVDTLLIGRSVKRPSGVW